MTGALLSTIGETGKHVSEMTQVKWGAKIAQRFHDEFLKSRLLKSRVQELFGVELT